MKVQDLFERASPKLSTAFNLTKKIRGTLSSSANQALERWLSYNWTSGSLSVDFKNGRSGTFKEIYDAFEPVRQELRRVYGETVTLYRGMRSGSEGHETGSNRLYSWTFDEQIAREYAFPNGNDVSNAILSQGQIDDIVDRYERTGKARYRGYYFIRQKSNPDFYDIYDRNRSHITDGDDFRTHIEDTERDISDRQSARDQSGSVTKSEIPVSDIVWFVTSSEKEVIVIGHAE